MQTSAKKVSAIIPTNNSTYLQSTVDSIVNHVDEILIINSGKAAIELTSKEKVEVIQFEQGSKNASEAIFQLQFSSFSMCIATYLTSKTSLDT